MRPDRYAHHVNDLPALSMQARMDIQAVAERFPLKVSAHYMSLIDWNDPDDPLRRIVIPDPEELDGGGDLDPSREADNTPQPGLQHKYPHTVLLLCQHTCAGACRFCFRKRVFMGEDQVINPDVSAGLDYIRRTPAVTNVLLTGGDPLTMSTQRLDGILRELRAIPHVGIIRLGSKLPAFDPDRIIRNSDLRRVLARHSDKHKRIYLMAHFDHPRELCCKSVEAMAILMQAGVVAVNQCPLLAGVNDEPRTLVALFRQLSFIGVPPYYLFQCRPTAGNRPFQVPITRGYAIFEAAKADVSGLAKRARFVISHASGKIEVVGVDAQRIYMRYHRAKDPADEGRFMAFRRDDWACWPDELEVAEGFDGFRPMPMPVETPAGVTGPE